jgi:hypothetical protein
VEQKVEFVFLEGNFILYFCFSVNVFQTPFNSRQINDKPGDQKFSSKVIEKQANHSIWKRTRDHSVKSTTTEL